LLALFHLSQSINLSNLWTAILIVILTCWSKPKRQKLTKLALQGYFTIVIIGSLAGTIRAPISARRTSSVKPMAPNIHQKIVIKPTIKNPVFARAKILALIILRRTQFLWFSMLFHRWIVYRSLIFPPLFYFKLALLNLA